MITKFGGFGGEPSVTIAAIRVFLRDGIVRAGAGLMSESNRGVSVAAEPGVRLRAGSAAALDHEGPPERPGDRGPAGARRLTSETAAMSRGCDRRVGRRFEKEGFAICWSTAVAVGVVARRQVVAASHAASSVRAMAQAEVREDPQARQGVRAMEEREQPGARRDQDPIRPDEGSWSVERDPERGPAGRRASVACPPGRTALER